VSCFKLPKPVVDRVIRNQSRIYGEAAAERILAEIMEAQQP